jgi:hypothetical protein
MDRGVREPTVRPDVSNDQRREETRLVEHVAGQCGATDHIGWYPSGRHGGGRLIDPTIVPGLHRASAPPL